MQESVNEGSCGGVFGERDSELATRYCEDCPKTWKVIRNKNIIGWSDWYNFDPKSCKHEDRHLKVMTDNIKYRVVNNTPAILFLAGPGWQSTASIPIADVQCNKCNSTFTSCAEMSTKKRWEKQKIVEDHQWIINRKKIASNK